MLLLVNYLAVDSTRILWEFPIILWVNLIYWRDKDRPLIPFFTCLQKSNALFTWSMDKLETTLFGAVDTLRPGFKLFEGTISQFDSLVCKSLDLMEQKVPNLYLPPTIMYWNTKEYMSDHLVRPVIKRAESFKELGNAVIDSPLDRLDHFVDAADKYVERYLPEGKDEVDNGELIRCVFDV